MTLPRNSFGKRTTADEAIAGRSLRGMKIVVTGAASGIGIETARTLAKAGASITLAVRNTGEGEKIASILQGTGHVVRPLDLSNLATVRSFAASVEGPFDVVIGNAGVMASPLSFTKQSLELQMGTNHVGHFLLVELLRPKLTAQARVVILASSAHTRGSGAGIAATLDDDRDYKKRKYAPFTAYGDSKLANILHARGLSKRLPQGQSAFAVHPGVIATNLIRHMGFLGTLWKAAGPILLKSPAQGAATTVFAATAPGLEAHSGIYLADCNEKTPSADGMSEELADKVWALTEKIVAAT